MSSWCVGSTNWQTTMRKRKPYDPARYDRRTTDLLRNAQVSPIEVDDPMEPGAKLIVMRSIRNDPLAGLHSRRSIDDAQFWGGRAFQKDFETAERGPGAIDPSKEAVDGGMAPEPITEAQQRSAKQLAVVYRSLGLNGSSLTQTILIHGLTIEQLCVARGASTETERKYLGKRF